jgi:diaminopimelate epimerase
MRFSKWHALGNAYLLIERAELGRELDAEAARRLCDVHFGVGADGVVEIVAIDGAEADVAIWNPDGTTAAFSGNGARIAALWLVRRSGVDAVQLRFGSRAVAARARGSDVELDVGRVEVGARDQLEVHGEPLEFTPVAVGNQHAVVRLDFDENDIGYYGPLIQSDPRFPDGTNVQLVRVLGPHELLVGVWERGAGATLSSGSSAIAAAAAAYASGWCESPITVAFSQAGHLLVEIGDDFHARLVGPAEEIFRGELVAGGHGAD